MEPMKVLVLGSGVIGVRRPTSWRSPATRSPWSTASPPPALETSYANAGEVSPGYSAPWAGPGVPLKAIKWLLMQHRPLVIRPHLDVDLMRWGSRCCATAPRARYEINKGRMVRLAEYSRDCLQALRAADRHPLRRAHAGHAAAVPHPEAARRQRRRHRDAASATASPSSCSTATAASATSRRWRGCATSSSAACACRATRPATASSSRSAWPALAKAQGVAVPLRHDDQAPGTAGPRIDGVVTDAGTLKADAYLVALGSYSPLLLRPLGIRIPVYPVKGYSITVPITDAAGAPESTVMDETHKVAVTRLGDRIRVGGTAELAGYTLKLHEARRQTLEHVVTDLFPRGGDVARAEFWCGLRPMTPDGTPVVGATPIPNLFLATGHGTLGWTMAAGTGRVMADVISGARRRSISRA